MNSNEHIRRALIRAGNRTRLTRLLHALVLSATLVLALGGLGTGLAAVVPLTGNLYFWYSVLAWLALAAFLARVLLPLRGRWTPERTALVLEGRQPELSGELMSALQLGADRPRQVGDLGISGEMIDALEGRVEARLPAILARPIADRRRLGRDAAVLGALLLTSAALWMNPGSGWSDAVAAILNPLSGGPFARPALEVSPGDVRLPEGGGLEVRARVRGGLSGRLQLEVKTASGTAPEILTMERRSPSEHALAIPRVVETLVYRVTHPRTASPWYTATVSAPPRAGDLALTLVPPAYTGLPPAEQEGTGHLRCLKGTTVRWRARASKPLAEAALVMSGGQTHPLAVRGETGIEGEFVVTQGGRYRIVLKDRDGFSAPRPDEYDINLLPDEFPVVELPVPAADLEVDPGALVQIEYAARDDFGLGGGNLVYRLENGTEGRIPLPDAGGKRAFAAGYEWDLGGLKLEPGSTVAFQVEVLDNDSISGPKAGVSPARALRVKDTRARHRDLAEMEKELVQDLTDLLGDELELSSDLNETARMESQPEGEFLTELREQTEGTRKANEKFSKAMDKMDELLREMSRDSLAEPSSVYQRVLARQMLGKAQEGEKEAQTQLEELAQMEDMARADKNAELSSMTKAREKRVASMEQALSLMQDADRYQKMEEAVRSQEEAMDKERDLLDRLEKMKGELDAAGARELMSAIQEIAEKLSDLARQLSSLQSELPEEFVNADAMKDLPFDDVMKDLKELAESIAKGDKAGARAKAEALLKKLSQMLETLRQASQKVRDVNRRSRDNFQQMRQGEIQKLAAAQRELLTRTEEANAGLERRLAAERKEKEAARRDLLARETAAALKGLEELRRELEQRAQRSPASDTAALELERRLQALRVAPTAGALERGPAFLEEARREAGKLAALLAGSPQAGEAAAAVRERSRDLAAGLDRAAEALRALEPASAGANEAERGRLKGLAGEQKVLGEKAVQIGGRLEQLAAGMPLIGPELVADVKEAAVFMQSASGKLEALQPGGALPDQREALYRLLKAQQEAEQAAQMMQKMSELQSGGFGGSGGEMEALFGLLPSSGSSGRDQREGGRRGISVRNFRIPGRQEYVVPRLFREEIMESMKAGYPRTFEKAIREYYRSIAE